jgi:hypothetical protein
MGASESQPGALESASVIFSNLVPDVLNLRVGRFEPAYHLLSSKRSYYLVSSYEIYGFPTANNNFLFDDNQIGCEVTGHFRTGTKYGAGIVNGTGALPDNNRFKDLYLTVSQTIGPGDGQSAGQRVGAFVYYGKQPLIASIDTLGTKPPAVSPTGEYPGTNNKAFYRYGGAASLNWGTLNLAAMYVHGQDDRALNALDLTKNYKFDGGFVELDYAGILNNRLVASALYNWIKPPDYDRESGKLSAYSALVRYYLGDMSALNVALHAEYSHRKIEMGTTTSTENLYSMLVDFAF